MRLSRLIAIGSILAVAAVPAASAPASAQPCEGVDCVTGPAGAAVCLVKHAKEWKQYIDDCFTQTTGPTL